MDIHKRQLHKVNTSDLKSIRSILKADKGSSFMKVKLSTRHGKGTKN